MLISVIGGSQCSPEEARWAEEVGRGLARRGATVVCGGLGGVMHAACKGARSAGGHTIGILPGDSRDSANPCVEIPIITGIGYARNSIVAKTGEAVIAIGGSFGTLSEIAYALQAGTPVIGLNTWSLCKDGQVQEHIIVAKGPVDAVKKAISTAEANTAARGAGKA